MNKVVGLGVIGSIILACGGGAPLSNEMNINRDGKLFSGRTGSDWTESELRNNAYGVVCGSSGKVENIQIKSAENGTLVFTGTCQ